MVCRDFRDPWNYLTVQLNRTSETGDPDLYGTFTGGPNRQVSCTWECQSVTEHLTLNAQKQQSLPCHCEMEKYANLCKASSGSTKDLVLQYPFVCFGQAALWCNNTLASLQCSPYTLCTWPIIAESNPLVVGVHLMQFIDNYCCNVQSWTRLHIHSPAACQKLLIHHNATNIPFPHLTFLPLLPPICNSWCWFRSFSFSTLQCLCPPKMSIGIRQSLSTIAALHARHPSRRVWLPRDLRCCKRNCCDIWNKGRTWPRVRLYRCAATLNGWWHTIGTRQCHMALLFRMHFSIGGLSKSKSTAQLRWRTQNTRRYICPHIEVACEDSRLDSVQ